LVSGYKKGAKRSYNQAGANIKTQATGIIRKPKVIDN
jgi:hypothetical protein